MQKPFKASPIITREFSPYSSNSPHPGIDLIPAGSSYLSGMSEREKSIQNAKRFLTKIIACLSGKVVYTGWITGAGNTVAVDTFIGSDIFRFIYCHLSEIRVKSKFFVKEGEILGMLGNTGTQDIHLHLSVLKNPCLPPDSFFEDKALINPLLLLGTLFDSADALSAIKKENQPYNKFDQCLINSHYA